MSGKNKTQGAKIDDLARRIVAGGRRALAQGITLVESARPDHSDDARALLAKLLPASGKSKRLGISGAPGVGKSTFIEAFGAHLLSAGHKVAVLAVDPSSARTGGSILADKTRMEALARSDDAFIRPSPAGDTLGGVASGTRDAIVLAEAAGFDVVIIETVGVGQAETAVAGMVDMFILLIAPGGGDELQGIKRGITELVDLVVVNKADGGLEEPAKETAAQYRGALNLLRSAREGWRPEVALVSALESRGIDHVWERVLAFFESRDSSGRIAGHRAEQARSWMWREIEMRVIGQMRRDPAMARVMADIEAKVAAGELTAISAADRILEAFGENGAGKGKS